MKKLRLMGSGNTKRSRSLAQGESAEVAAKGKPHKSGDKKPDQETKAVKDVSEKKASRGSSVSRQSAEQDIKNPKEQQQTMFTLRDDLENSNRSRQSADFNEIFAIHPDPANLLLRGLERKEDESKVTILDGKQVYSSTLENTKKRLEDRGLTDKTLVEHTALSPALEITFIGVHNKLKEAKKGLGKEYYYSRDGGIYRPLDRISDAYTEQNLPSKKIALADFLADNQGFEDLIKDIILKLEADFPNVLSYDRESLSELIPSARDSNETEVKKAQDFLSLTVLCAINYTDFCDAMNLAFNEVGLVPILMDIVEKTKDCTEHQLKYMDSDGNLTKKTVRGIILSRVLGTLHNLSKRVPTRASFNACDAVKVVLPLIEDKVPLYATKGLLLLAYLIDEENNHLLMANEGPIKYLVSLIDKANQRSNQRFLGFSNSELAEGLAQIAINDSNKKQIVANGAIPVLTRMIRRSKFKEAETAAAEALWVLAFDDENKEKMRSDQQCLDMLNKLKRGSNAKAKRAASGALWEIEGKQQHSKEMQQQQQQQRQQQQQEPTKRKRSAAKASKSTDKAVTQDEEESSAMDSTAGGPTTNHVMISYQWDVQKTLIQVKDSLQAAGYRVWMDLEQMGGSTLEAMARAVENSAVVLVCVSQKYKESSNCRSEAEYAFQLKKDIIPLMMDRNYRPDGWLGMIMGSKLWIDFSQRHGKLDTSMRDLQKELGVRGKGDAEIVQVRSVDVVDAKPTIDISGWTSEDVINWMKGFDIVLKKKNPRVTEKLTGPVLTRLQALRNESPEFYYSSLKDDIGLCDVFDVMLFTDKLEQLVQ